MTSSTFVYYTNTVLFEQFVQDANVADLLSFIFGLCFQTDVFFFLKGNSYFLCGQKAGTMMMLGPHPPDWDEMT